MAIPSALLKPIYFAYDKGVVGDNIQYSEPIKIYAQKEDVKSRVLRGNAGFVPDYDRLINVPMGELTQYLNEQSLLWVDVEPNAKKSNVDYKIEQLGDIVDGNRILYCNSMAQSFKSIYYLDNGVIYQVKVDFNNLVALVPFNKYLPITSETKVWATKPTSASSTTNLIRLVSKERELKGYKLTFEKVLNGNG